MTTTTIDFTDVVSFIADEATSEQIDIFYAAAKTRSKALRAAKASTALASFNIGDKCTLTGLSPKYLNGLPVEIVGRKDTKFSVKLTGDSVPTWQAQRRFGDRPFLVPASALVAS